MKKENEQRRAAIQRLRQSLTPEQVADLQLVITETPEEGDWCFSADGSVWEYSASATLEALARELNFKPGEFDL